MKDLTQKYHARDRFVDYFSNSTTASSIVNSFRDEKILDVSRSEFNQAQAPGYFLDMIQFSTYMISDLEVRGLNREQLQEGIRRTLNPASTTLSLYAKMYALTDNQTVKFEELAQYFAVHPDGYQKPKEIAQKHGKKVAHVGTSGNVLVKRVEQGLISRKQLRKNLMGHLNDILLEE